MDGKVPLSPSFGDDVDRLDQGGVITRRGTIRD